MRRGHSGKSFGFDLAFGWGSPGDDEGHVPAMVMLLIAGLLTADVAETQSPTSKSYWGERTLNGIV